MAFQQRRHHDDLCHTCHFQPELRRALEEFSLDPFKNLFKAVPEYDIKRVINEVVRAVELLSANRTGALIVLK